MATGDGSDGVAPAHYAAPDRCPDCWQPLSGSRCSACGLVLTEPFAGQLFEASRQVDFWLAQRKELIGKLRAVPLSEVLFSPPAPETRFADPSELPVPDQLSPTTPDSPFPPLLLPLDSSAGSRTSRLRNLTLQSLLVGLGALLLAVAAVIFLAFSWDRLGITGRSLVLAGLTVSVLAGSALARRAGLRATAEAVGALGVVLVILDAAAIRATGLAGTEWPWLGYASLAAFACTVALAATAVVVRARSISIASAILAPITLVAAGCYLAVDVWPYSVAALAGGLVLSGAPALAAPWLRRRGLPAEATLLTWAGYLLPVFSVAILPFAPVWQAALVLAIAAGLAIAHAVVESGAVARAWAVTAGATAALALACGTVHLVHDWAVGVAPFVVGLLALILALAVRDRRLIADAEVGALAAGAIVVLPAMVLAASMGLDALLMSRAPWTAQAGTRWYELSTLARDLGRPPTAATSSALGGLLALVVIWALRRRLQVGFENREDLPDGTAAVEPSAPSASLTLSVRDIRQSAAAAVAAGLISLVVLAAPWQQSLPVVADVLIGATLATLAAVAGRVVLQRRPGRVSGRLLTGCAGVTTVATVLAAWTWQTLSVPITVFAVAALVLAARATRWSALWAPITASTLLCVAAGTVTAGLRWGDGLLMQALCAAVAILVLTRMATSRGGDVIAGTAVAGYLVGFAALGLGDSSNHVVAWTRATGLLAVGSTVATVVALDHRSRWPQWVRVVAISVAGPMASLAVWAGSTALTESGRTDVNRWVVLGILTVAQASLVVLLHRADEERQALAVPAERSLALLSSVVLIGGVFAGPAWAVLTALAVAACVIATLPARRHVAWLALILGSCALWARLTDANVVRVEAYSVPPGLVLTAAAVWAVSRDGRWRRPAVWAAVVTLILPSSLVATTGDVVRPLVLAGLGLLSGVLAVRDRAHPDRAIVWSLLTVLALLGPWTRGLINSQVGARAVDGWALVAVVGLGLLAWAQWHHPRWRPGWSLALVLLVGALPVLIGTAHDVVMLVRLLVVIAVAGGLLVWSQSATAVLIPGRQTLTSTVVVVLAVASVMGLWLRLPGPADIFTVVPGAFVIGAGVVGMRRVPESNSWSWLAAGLLIVLTPSLIMTLGGGQLLRVIAVAIVSAAILLVGVRLRWQAPVVIGSVVLAVHGLLQLAPYFAQLYSTVPRWATLGLIGALLLALGARFERRVADLLTLRSIIATYR